MQCAQTHSPRRYRAGKEAVETEAVETEAVKLAAAMVVLGAPVVE